MRGELFAPLFLIVLFYGVKPMADMIKDGKKLTTTGEYFKGLQKKTPTEIAYVANDAQLALNAMPNGVNAKYYRQEVILCLAELKCR